MALRDLRPLPAALLVALSLTGCPAGEDKPPDTDTGGTDTADTDTATETGDTDTGDTDTGDTDTGDTDTGDTSESDTGDTGDTDTGNTSDTDTGDTSDTDAGDTSDTDTGDTSDTDTGDTSDTADTAEVLDADHDGSPADVDCDDADPSAFPGNVESCDEVDNDCDGAVDEDAVDAPTWYDDLDADGHGAGTGTEACEPAAGQVALGDDCDDDDDAVNPDAVEVCDAADVDDDCDGRADDADSSVTGRGTWYRDVDRDGYAGTSTTTACDQPAYTYTTSTDCNDSNAAVNPGAAEVCDAADTDEDCDGRADDDDSSASGQADWYADRDRDGYGGTTSVSACDAPVGYLATSTDCDDGNASVNPAGREVCDAADADEDCDGAADDADSSVTGTSTWYRDADSDGYGGTTRTSACAAPAGYVAGSTDCNDGNAAINPGADEVCDDLDADEDCDGRSDDSDASVTGRPTWYRDNDRDGYGGSTTNISCNQPSGYVATGGDCNDSNTSVSPGDPEVCDSSNTDEDCDGLADNDDSSASGTTTWYVDADGDGYGSTTTANACDRAAGYVSNASDCDDTDASVTTTRSWYRDQDSDGYGTGAATSSCSQPSGYASTNGDCDDRDATVSPDATEVCDDADVDEDCDGRADDSDPSVTGTTTWYIDLDSDTYGGTSSVRVRCDRPTTFYVANGDDCDDSRGSVNPGAVEVCDAADLDEDCDGAADDADPSVTGTSTWYRDADLDGYGTVTTTSSACSQPSGYVSPLGDCLDSDATVSPAGVEVCGDGVDQDCSGADEVCPDYTLSGAYAVDDPQVWATIEGVNADDGYGTAVTAGDFDGDGVGDFIVTAYGATWGTSERGVIYGYYGGVAAGYQDADDDVDFVYYDTSRTDVGFSNYVVNIGDVDGDGREDLAIHAEFVQRVVFGGDTGAAGFTSSVYDGTFSADGYVWAGGNSAGSDGTWLLANPEDDTRRGVVYVTVGTSGTTTATILGEDIDDKVGTSATGESDLDGDGIDDLALTSPNYTCASGARGALLLFAGPVTGDLVASDADGVVHGDTDGFAGVGWGVGAVGDLDGDGDDDLMVGQFGRSDGVYYDSCVNQVDSLVTGERWVRDFTPLTLCKGYNSSLYVGVPMSGDFNGDGEPDLLIPDDYASETGARAGTLFVQYGPFSGEVTLDTDADVRLDGIEGDWIGEAYRYAVVPDVDADGDDELLMTSLYRHPTMSWSPGFAWFWHGELD